MANQTAEKAPIQPEELAALTKEFSESPFGIEFIDIMKEQVKGYTDLSRKIDAPRDVRMAAADRAAGVQEMIDFIDLYVKYADQPQLLQDAKGEEASAVSSDDFGGDKSVA